MSGGGPTAPLFASEQTAAAGPRTLTRYAREKAGVWTVAVVPAGPAAAPQQSTEPTHETCGRSRVERRERDTGAGITVTLLVGMPIAGHLAASRAIVERSSSEHQGQVATSGSLIRCETVEHRDAREGIADGHSITNSD